MARRDGRSRVVCRAAWFPTARRRSGQTVRVLHTVYLPALGSDQLEVIVAGAGIVGELQDDGLLLLDFEGNTIGSPSLERFANRALKAAARQAAHYPTRARLLVPPEQALAIGEFDSREQVIRLTGADSRKRLSAWLGAGTRRR